ncbi:uncharacterized protein LOC142628692 [Castanea sativa]|uniref:uncharacterized protein LOC142628692 n=1 Tax=Castanea sativa TaxID=21020 RepID=UPI003F64C904
MRQLMRRIEEYKRLEDDRLQNKGKAPVVSNPRQGSFQLRPRKNLRIQEPEARVGEVNVAFKESVHKIVDRIKHEPYFRVLKDHLGQLVKAGDLKEFVVDLRNQEAGQDAWPRGNPLSPPRGVIEVIHVASRGTLMSGTRGVLAVVLVGSGTDDRPPKKKLKHTLEIIAFDDDDLEGTIQPHDDALVVMARINGFIVKRVMMDQGSGAEVMYPDLFRGLGLKKEDLSKYDTPLVGFDGQMVIPEGQLFLPVNMKGKEVI